MLDRKYIDVGIPCNGIFDWNLFHILPIWSVHAVVGLQLYKPFHILTFSIFFAALLLCSLCSSFRKPLTANDMFIIKCWNSLNIQLDGSVKCSRLEECNTEWQSFAAKCSHFLCFCGATSELPSPAPAPCFQLETCNLLLAADTSK